MNRAWVSLVWRYRALVESGVPIDIDSERLLEAVTDPDFLLLPGRALTADEWAAGNGR